MDILISLIKYILLELLWRGTLVPLVMLVKHLIYLVSYARILRIIVVYQPEHIGFARGWWI